MAERDAQVRFKVRPDGDNAKPLKDMADAGRRAHSEVKRIERSLRDLSPPAKDASTKVSDLFLSTQKRAKDAEVRVNELSGAIKRLGLNTQQVAGMARQLGREFQLSAKQIDEALSKAGQSGIGAPGGRGGFPGRFKGLFGGGQPRGLGALLGLSAIGRTAGILGDAFNDPDTMAQIQRELARTRSGRFSQAINDLPVIGGFSRFAQNTVLAFTGEADALARSNAAVTSQERANAERRAKETAQAESTLAREAMARNAARGRAELDLLARTAGIADPLARRRAEIEGTIGLERKDLAQAGREFTAAGRLASGAEGRERLIEGDKRLAESMHRQVDAAGKLVELEKQRRELIAAASEKEQDRLKLLRAQAAAEEDRFKKVAEFEKGRVQGFREEFGALDPSRQQTAVELARRFRARGQFRDEEFDLAKGFGFFREAVGQDASRRADAGGFAELVQLLGLDAKQREAERQAALQATIKAELTNKLTVEIKQNEQNLAQQLVQQLLPAMMRQQALLAQQVQQELAKQERAAAAGRRLGMG